MDCLTCAHLRVRRFRVYFLRSVCIGELEGRIRAMDDDRESKSWIEKTSPLSRSYMLNHPVT